MIRAFANQNSERESQLDPGCAAARQVNTLELEPFVCVFIVVDDAGRRCPKFTSDIWLCAISASPKPTRPGGISSMWDAVYRSQPKVI